MFALGKFAQALLPEEVAASDPWRRILQQALAQERFLRLRSAAQLAALINREFPVARPSAGRTKLGVGLIAALAVAVVATVGVLVLALSRVGVDAERNDPGQAARQIEQNCAEVTIRGVETDSKKVSKIEGLQQKTISLYVSKEEDSEVVIEIPKGQKLSVSEAIEFTVYDDAIVNAAMNQDWAKVRALQKSFKLKKITLKVVGGGELDAKAYKFSIIGVEDDAIVVKPEMKIST